MEREDFGLILQAAAGCFDLTRVDSRYRTRLALVLDELGRRNLAAIRVQDAMQCAIGQVGADKQSRDQNYENMRWNRDQYKRLLHVNTQEDTEDSGVAALIKEWKKRYGQADTASESGEAD